MNNNDPMITHRVGRFVIQVPKSMAVAHRSSTFRGTELQEVPWPKEADHEKARQSAWDSRFSRIKGLKAPRGKMTPLVHQQALIAGLWAYGVLYLSEPGADDIANWEILADYGDQGVWFKYNGLLEAKAEMLDWVLDIARAYRTIDVNNPPKENWFYLEHGAIALPYLEQEEVYARFEGHKFDMKLRVETTEIHKDEAPDAGLIARTAAAMASGLASGVEIKKIRSGKRRLADLDGEEEVVSAVAGAETQLDFGWRFAGRKDSGDFPKICVRMEASGGQLDEKLKIWDAILDSFRPVGK